MISPEPEPSPDKLTSQFSALHDATFALARQPHSPLEATLQDFHPLECTAGTAVMSRLAPDAPLGALYDIRDIISAEHQRIITKETEIIEPETIFRRWVKRFRNGNTSAPSASAVRLPRTAIVDPIQGATQQLLGMDASRNKAIVLRTSRLSGSFTHNDKLYTFAPEAELYEIGALELATNQDGDFLGATRKEFYAFVPQYDNAYRDIDSFGLDPSLRPLPEEKYQKALARATRLLESFHAAPIISSWS